MMSALADAITPTALRGLEAALNSLWQGVLVVAVVWWLLRWVPRLNAATRCAVWYATLVALVLLPALSGRLADTAPSAGPPKALQPRPDIAIFTSVASARELARTGSEARPFSPGEVTKPTPRSEEPPVLHARETAPAVPAYPVQVKGGRWVLLLAGLWLAVVMVKWSRLAISLIQIRRIKSRALPGPPAGGLPGPVHLVAGLPRRAKFGWSSEIQSPAVLGFFRPAVLFPTRLWHTLSATESEQVALHELAHLARLDDWWQVLQRFMEALLFFHPAVHFVSQRITLEREIACDDWVTHRAGRPGDYARCLTRLAALRSVTALPVPGAVLTRKHMVRRIEMILNTRRNSRPGVSRSLSVVAVTVLALLVLQSAFVRPVVAVTHPPAANSAPVARPANTPAPPRAGFTSEVPTAPEPVPAAEPPAGAPRWAQAEPPAPTPRPDAPATPAPPAPPAPSQKQGYSEEATHSGSSLSIDQDGDETVWSWSNGRQRVRAEMSGRVKFSGAGTSVESISDDGYFMIEERTGSKRRELEVVSGRHDSLEYYYFEDREPAPWDAAAQAWFAELLPEMMRESGIGAQERVEALRRDAGVSGVLQEISFIHSDFVKRIYFRALLASGPLNPDETRALFRQAGREIDSDYEMAELLIEYAEYAQGDAETRDALVEAVSTMESDYEIRRVLSAMGTRENLDDAYVTAVIELAAAMDSDYEKAELLLELADYSRESAPARDLYLDAVASIDSDYEKRRVLEGLLVPNLADEAFVDRVLEIAQTIGSDYERAELLIRMADHAAEHETSLLTYLAATTTLGSDYEMRRALSAVPWENGVSDRACEDLMRAVSRINSDYEKAEFLLEYGEYFNQSDAQRDAFDQAVESIDSDYDRQRVESEFYRKSKKNTSSRNTY